MWWNSIAHDENLSIFSNIPWKTKILVKLDPFQFVASFTNDDYIEDKENESLASILQNTT